MIDRLIAITLSATVLCGCNFTLDPVIAACDDAIKARLRSPSTYQRVEVQSYPRYDISVSAWLEAFAKVPAEDRKHQAERAERAVQQDQSLDLAKHFISYDAANAYGTPVRSMVECSYPMIDGKLNGISKSNVLIDGQTHLDWMITRLRQ